MIEIHPVKNAQEVREIESLQKAVWGGGIVPYNIIHAIAHADGIVLGAFDGHTLIGFVLSFAGFINGERLQWSHMTAVLPVYQRQGIGRDLKFEQRRIALEHGYNTIAWTCDPLRRKNAIFNFCYLGTTTQIYLVEQYGKMNDEINRGLLSDRFEIRWDLRSERVSERLSAKKLPFQRDFASETPSERLILARNNLEPVLKMDRFRPTSSQPEYLLELPADIEKVRTTSHELTHRWYFAMREACQTLFSAGYHIDSVVLQKNNPDSFFYLLHDSRVNSYPCRVN